MRLKTPALDFIVIGAQKAGTTSLWRYLQDNRELRLPADKEASFFSEKGYPDDWRGYMRALFKDAPRGVRLGTVTPIYMHGVPDVPVPVIADRIRRTVPDVRLIGLLRDPVERAHSAYRMLVARGLEQRSFARAVAEQLEPSALERARACPAITDSYVTAGEYGRMLSDYLERFPREQLHVEWTTDLDREPAAVVARICEFLGVAPHEPAQAGRRFNPSGGVRVSTEAAADLHEYLERNVWPRMRHAAQHRAGFERWFELWNTVPAPSEDTLDEQTAERLREHYAGDAQVLESVTGLRTPWKG